MSYPLVGSCQCGQVTITIKQPPKAVFACHCRECQKLSTAPLSVTAIFDQDNIAFSGELKSWQRMADSGNKNEAKFCPDCGNRIYHVNPDEPTSIKLKLKPVNIEDDHIFEPQAHLWVGEKLSWVQIPEGMKTFPGQPT